MEALFIAANVAEAELVEVLDGQAEDCRRLLAERGLKRGVL